LDGASANTASIRWASKTAQKSMPTRRSGSSKTNAIHACSSLFTTGIQAPSTRRVVDEPGGGSDPGPSEQLQEVTADDPQIHNAMYSSLFHAVWSCERPKHAQEAAINNFVADLCPQDLEHTPAYNERAGFPACPSVYRPRGHSHPPTRPPTRQTCCLSRPFCEP